MKKFSMRLYFEDAMYTDIVSIRAYSEQEAIEQLNNTYKEKGFNTNNIVLLGVWAGD